MTAAEHRAGIDEQPVRSGAVQINRMNPDDRADILDRSGCAVDIDANVAAGQRSVESVRDRPAVVKNDTVAEVSCNTTLVRRSRCRSSRAIKRRYDTPQAPPPERSARFCEAKIAELDLKLQGRGIKSPSAIMTARPKAFVMIARQSAMIG
jgi:hypothetical protein